jgi:hypothetical protein
MDVSGQLHTSAALKGIGLCVASLWFKERKCCEQGFSSSVFAGSTWIINHYYYCNATYYTIKC